MVFIYIYIFKWGFTLFQCKGEIGYTGATGSHHQSISDLTQPMNHES